MVTNRALLSIALAPLLACCASASQFVTTDACIFTFSVGDLPNFQLPEAGPNSPGDVQLNEGNGIITRGSVDNDVNGTLYGCNGESSAYFVGDDTWNTTYISNDGDELDIDVFFATFQNELWVRHLQPHMDPSLYEALNETVIRLNITCGEELEDTTGCIEFTASFTEATPYNMTDAFEFEDECFHGFSSGAQVSTVQVHAASPVGPASSASLGSGHTLILAGKADEGLPWSEGFYANGSQKDDAFWGKWWSTINSRYNSLTGEDDGANHVEGVESNGFFCPTGETTCGSIPCGSYWQRGSGTETCPNEIEEQGFCCPATCGTCGGAGCGQRPGGSACCISVLQRNGPTCDERDIAPCILNAQAGDTCFNGVVENGCTGTVSEFWDPRFGVWRSDFQTPDGESHDLDMFYLNMVDGLNELWVTEIESWMAPSLYNQLQHNYVKLTVTCPEDNVAVESCVIFKPTFTNWSPEVDGAKAGYRFSDPALPSFDLPAAVPNSPGDVLLTTNNGVVTKTGAETETSCNGDSAEYFGEDGNWYNQFLKFDGAPHELRHVFYPTERNLYAATIQSVWEPNLRSLLVNRIVRMKVWCTNDERAQYLFFRVSGEPAECDDIDDLCTDVVTGGTLQLVPTFKQCATTLSAAYLIGWLSAGH